MKPLPKTVSPMPKPGSSPKDLWLASKNHYDLKGKNTFNSLKFFLCFSQCMGILPLHNILKGYHEVKFVWTSLRVLSCIFYIFCLTVTMFFCTLYGFDNGYTMEGIENQVFYAGSLINSILYLRLARVWPSLMRKWCAVDEIMNRTYNYPKRIDFKLRFLGFLYLALGAVEHGLGVANRYYDAKYDLKENYTAAAYYNRTLKEMFWYVNFSTPLGVFTSMVTTHANFCWAFNDFFIIMMSTILASRFRQIAVKISEEYESPKSLHFWQEVRKDYDRLCDLCADLNSHISLLIMLSYFQNICFILVQLFHSIEIFDNRLEKAYFMFSSCYLLFKTCSVSLYAASINDESRAPALYLNTVSSKFYNPEIKRMLIQISFDTVVLSGCKMFKIKRGLLLSIATAIVTYELLLIQLTSILVVDNKAEDMSGPEL